MYIKGVDIFTTSVYISSNIHTYIHTRDGQYFDYRDNRD